VAKKLKLGERRRYRPTVMDAIVYGAFMVRVSPDQIMRALKLSREQVEESIRRGVRWY
jgi:hypothetical protein